jgi:ABC-type nitrate/sulfonate/bicarbonate transport system permease component
MSEVMSVAAAKRRRDAKLPAAMLSIACVILVPAVALEVIVRTGAYHPIFLPAPSEVLRAVVQLARDAQVRGALLDIVVWSGEAVLIATVIGTVVGCVLGAWPLGYRAYIPMLSTTVSIPKIIFFPIIILLFGIGGDSKVAYGTLSAVFYVTLTVAGGARNVDRGLLRMMKAFGGSRIDALRRVVIPSTIPAITVGVWVGIKHAVNGVLIAELYVSINGIGADIHTFTEQLQAAKVYAVALIVTVIAVAAAWLWGRVDRRVDSWRALGAS